MNQLTIDDLITAFKFPLDGSQKRFVRKAYEFAKKAHQGQQRASGVEYIQHPLAVARILAQIGANYQIVSAGLLHDVPEDTPETLAHIKKEFGPDVALMVDGITKLGKIKLRESKEESMLENLRRMFLAMAADISTVVIKLADRLHNMRTLEHLRPDKQRRIAHETMEIYVPIANRLGIGEIRGELSDLCFRYLDPENYTTTKTVFDQQYKETEKYLLRAIDVITKELKREKIALIDIHGRAKSLYSLFLKLQRNEMDVKRIYDLAAIRIIVPDIVDCYETLGIIHKQYRPMIGRIKDYISIPKPNGYKSLHTTIFGPEGRVIEVQIRTQQMHNEAEFGIAAHWLYDEQKKSSWRDYFSRKKHGDAPKGLTWVNQLQEWQISLGADSQEFMEGLKIDFFKDRIFAFTPEGDIIDLPEEATPVDFAYAVHTEIGHSTVGARVDGAIVPLDHHIKNGQVIEILTDKNRTLPNSDWLQFVKTHTAKTSIRRALQRKNSEDF